MGTGILRELLPTTASAHAVGGSGLVPMWRRDHLLVWVRGGAFGFDDVGELEAHGSVGKMLTSRRKRAAGSLLLSCISGTHVKLHAPCGR